MPVWKRWAVPENRFEQCPSACGLLLLAFLLCCNVAAASVDDFISLPPELASKVPARLVFSQAELIQCWQEPSARRCVLRGVQGLGCGRQSSAKHLRGCFRMLPPLISSHHASCTLSMHAPYSLLLPAGPIVLDSGSWQQAFASTGGSATVSPKEGAQPSDRRFTLTSGVEGGQGV